MAKLQPNLEGYGFKVGEDIIISPVLNDLRIIAQMESVQAKLIFSSGFPADDNPKFGGGLYELMLDGYDWSYRKIHSGGPVHGIYKYKDTFLAVDQIKGLLQFDKDYNIIKQGNIPDSSRCHGISYSEITNNFLCRCESS